MKRYYRYIPLVAVGVICLIWFVWTVAFSYVWPKPDPPSPNPIPIERIVGPINVTANELVVYTTSEKVKFTKWTTVPDGPQTKVTNDGQVLVIVFNSPGEYYIVLASGAGKGVELTKIRIKVGGEGPDPPRPPPIPPNPDPEGPDAVEWAKWSKTSALKLDYRGAYTDITALSGQLSSYAAQIAAGAAEDTKAVRVRIRQITNSTLKENAKYWVYFSKEYVQRTEKFTKLKEYQVVCAAMAAGFKSAADSMKVPKRATNPYDAAIEKSKIDKLPILVVITSSGCPPCELLKREWLPNIKVNGEYRLVMLDRLKHKDVVETVGTKGMKGSIKVPQVHILRYIDGKWQQFGRVGYSSFSSMDRWVKSVFAWEEEK